MTPKQVKDIFDKLPSKRRKVLEGFLAGHSRAKIMIDADVPSDAALTGHLKELYKNFGINTGWNDADDRRSGERKLPLLISLFARCKPELISARISDVLDGMEPEEAIAKPHQESKQPDASLIEERYLRATSNFDSLEPLERKSRIQVLEEIASNQDFPRYHWKVMEFLTDFVRNTPRRKEEESISPDIQAALTVIGRRDPKKDKGLIDLRNTDIRGADLKRAKLPGVKLDGANLQGSNLQLANLQRAYLTQANLQEAKLSHANLQGAYLISTNLQRAFLYGTNLQEATLWQANLQEATLREANLQEAILWGANLSGAKVLTSSQVESAEGNNETRLPSNLETPIHWAQVKTGKGVLLKKRFARDRKRPTE